MSGRQCVVQVIRLAGQNRAIKSTQAARWIFTGTALAGPRLFRPNFQLP